MRLKAGTAKTDITPPVGTMMAAFPVKRKPVLVAHIQDLRWHLIMEEILAWSLFM